MAGHLLAESSTPLAAIPYYDKSGHLYHELNNTSELAFDEWAKGEAYTQAKDSTAALLSYQQALTLFMQAGELQNAAIVRFGSGQQRLKYVRNENLKVARIYGKDIQAVKEKMMMEQKNLYNSGYGYSPLGR